MPLFVKARTGKEEFIFAIIFSKLRFPSRRSNSIKQIRQDNTLQSERPLKLPSNQLSSGRKRGRFYKSWCHYSTLQYLEVEVVAYVVQIYHNRVFFSSSWTGSPTVIPIVVWPACPLKWPEGTPFLSSSDEIIINSAGLDDVICSPLLPHWLNL